MIVSILYTVYGFCNIYINKFFTYSRNKKKLNCLFRFKALINMSKIKNILVYLNKKLTGMYPNS